MQADHGDTGKSGQESQALTFLREEQQDDGRSQSPVWQWMFWNECARGCRRWFEMLTAGPEGGFMGGRIIDIIGEAPGKEN